MPNTTRYGHKHLIPLSPNDIGLCVAVACSLFIASGAGVGGGILVVPALLMIGGFGSVDGVGLSNITVLSLAVAALFFQVSRRSPVRDAPLIDWDLVMLFGPPSVVGSISGSYINMIIPSWVTKVTLFLLLIPITWRMVQKARTLYRNENAAKQQLKQQIAREEAAQLPLLQVGMLGLIVSSVVITNITGGYLVHCGTLRYWLVVLSPLPLMLLVWGVIRQHVLWKADVKRCLGLKQAGDLKWNRRNTILYPAFCISAGLIAGLLGLGGGLILTPLMLELGVHPAVSVASSQITMLIGNSTSAIVYAVAGAIPWDYGVTLITIGFISALLGQIIVSWLVRKLGRSSLIVIVLSCMFTLALGASLTVVVTTMIDISKHPAKLTAHKAVCIR
ncbi:hypothetical protein OEZ86_009614 [Tetradesmus obliquus]|nr:hypothetical protein OEZ85_001057 [Tetradesmus obliquus]WIA43089.1 hypothetical protein OEZ86_009614 [Tetradesmus obliquus]